MEMQFISNSINICQHDSLNYSNIIKKLVLIKILINELIHQFISKITCFFIRNVMNGMHLTSPILLI